jgi:hypothetical protein
MERLRALALRSGSAPATSRAYYQQTQAVTDSARPPGRASLKSKPTNWPLRFANRNWDHARKRTVGINLLSLRRSVSLDRMVVAGSETLGSALQSARWGMQVRTATAGLQLTATWAAIALPTEHI